MTSIESGLLERPREGSEGDREATAYSSSILCSMSASLRAYQVVSLCGPSVCLSVCLSPSLSLPLSIAHTRNTYAATARGLTEPVHPPESRRTR